MSFIRSGIYADLDKIPYLIIGFMYNYKKVFQGILLGQETGNQHILRINLNYVRRCKGLTNEGRN